MPLIDLQKSSNTVALVESFLGEFKPDDEGTPEPKTPDKSAVKLLVENQAELCDEPQKSEETMISDSQIPIKLEHDVSVNVEVSEPEISDICVPEIKSDDTTKENIVECVAPIIEQPPPPPPTPPPVKRKVK